MPDENHSTEQGPIGVVAAATLLEATPTEVRTWRDRRLIPVVRWEPVVKFGRETMESLHDPAVLASLRSQVAHWRGEDEARRTTKQAPRRNRQQAQGLYLRAFRTLLAQAKTEFPGLAGFDLPDAFGAFHVIALLRVEGVVPGAAGEQIRWRIKVCAKFNPYDWRSQVEPLAPNGAPRQAQATALGQALAAAGADVEGKVRAAVEAGSRDYFGAIGAAVAAPASANGLWRDALSGLSRSAGMADGGGHAPGFLRQVIASLAAARAESYLKEVQSGFLRQATGLHNFTGFFPRARALRRRFVFYAGPTNSGKSHRGFEALAAASAGVYLAPLRLLALEGQERLEAMGVPCSLVTGEERALRDGARHVASTIEMLDLDGDCSVALIDEIQMLADPDRGWAWTQACVGVPAPQVILTGSAEVLPLVERLLAQTGDELVVEHLDRLAPLSPLQRAVRSRELAPGDAVIAFSRRDVLELRTELMEQGHRVAVVYGALGPEVRRAEAARYRSGEAAILIATDAIGMGLNLPIRRVLFSNVVKWDGSAERYLTPAEIKQIAGRAGRYGQHEEGYVGVLHGVPIEPVTEALELPNPAPKQGHFWVQPPWSVVEYVARELATDRLLPVLEHIRDYVLGDNPLWRHALTEDALAVVALVDSVPLPLRERFAYVGTPVDIRVPASEQAFGGWLRNHAKALPNPVPLLRAEAPKNEHGLQTLEQHARLLTVYLWLALRWPAIYPDEQAARADQHAANEQIAAALRQRALHRVCRECGCRLSREHRFPLCDGCFHASRYARGW